MVMELLSAMKNRKTAWPLESGSKMVGGVYEVEKDIIAGLINHVKVEEFCSAEWELSTM